MPTMAATYISFSQVEREEDQIITPSWDAVASAIAKLAGGGGLEAPTDHALRGRDDSETVQADFPAKFETLLNSVAGYSCTRLSKHRSYIGLFHSLQLHSHSSCTWCYVTTVDSSCVKSLTRSHHGRSLYNLTIHTQLDDDLPQIHP